MSTVTNPIPFNPDEWLAKNTSAPVAETLPTPLTPPTAQPSGFDPDAWLSKQVAAPPIAAPAMPEDAKFTNLMDIDTIIGNAAKLNGLDPKLVRSVIQQESGGNPTAKSPKGAQGLMQLMPETAKELGVTNPNDPNENVMGGTKYLSQQLKAFGGDVDLALAAYNWGPGNVSKRLQKGMTKEQILDSAPEETKGYVARIRQMMEREGRIAATTENMRQSSVMNTPIIGPAITGIAQAGADWKGVGERVTDFAGVTNRATNQSAEDALIASEAFARAQPGMLPQTISGVTRSLTNMAPAISVGMVNPIAGRTLAAVMPAVTTYSATEQATGDTGHAIRQGLIEGGITGAFSAMGLQGLEKVAAKGFRIGLKALGIDTLAELGEENAIQVLQNVERWYTNNFDPEKKMTVTEALEGTKQATIQTLATMFVVRGGQTAASRVLGRPVGVDQGEPDVPPAVAPTEAPAPIQAAEPQFVTDLRAALDTPGAKVRFHDSNRAVDTADVDISADGMTVHVAGDKEPISVTSLRDILVRGKRIDQTIWEDQGQFVPGWNVRQGTPEAGEITGPLAGLGQFPDKPQASQNVADFIKNPMHTFTFAMPYQNADGETLYRPVKVNGNLVMATDATANRLSIKGSKSIPDGMVDANSLLRVERNTDRLGEQGETLYENTDLAGMVAASKERSRANVAGIAPPAEPKPIDTSLYFGRKLYRQLNEVTGNQEEADALFRLVQARAEALGEDVDRFVARHGLEVQKALGQAQTVAEAQEILTAAQGKKPTREAARAKLREAKQAQTEALANVPAEKPNLEQIQQAEFFYNTKAVQNANQKLSAGTEKTKNEVLAEFRRDVRKRGIKPGRDTAEDLGISGWFFKKDATDSWDQVVQEGKAMGLVPGDMGEIAALQYLLTSPLTIKQSMDDAYYFQALSKPAQDAWTFYGGPDNAVSSLKRHISAMRKVGKDPSGWQALVDEFQRVGNSVAPDPDAQPQNLGGSQPQEMGVAQPQSEGGESYGMRQETRQGQGEVAPAQQAGGVQVPSPAKQPIETTYSAMQDSDGTWMVLRGKETISRGWKDQAQAEQVIAAEQEDENTLFQGPKGSIEFLEDGRTIIRAFESADVSTIAHELGHVFRRDISGPDLAAAEQWAGARNGIWTRDAEEKFARGFERYLRNGKAPTPELRTVFQKFRDWLHNIYQTIRGTSLAVNMTPEMIAVYDNMFKPQGKGVVANEKQGQRQGRQEVLATGRGAEMAPSPATVPPIVTAAQVPPQPMVEAAQDIPSVLYRGISGKQNQNDITFAAERKDDAQAYAGNDGRVIEVPLTGNEKVADISVGGDIRSRMKELVPQASDEQIEKALSDSQSFASFFRDAGFDLIKDRDPALAGPQYQFLNPPQIGPRSVPSTFSPAAPQQPTVSATPQGGVSTTPQPPMPPMAPQEAILPGADERNRANPGMTNDVRQWIIRERNADPELDTRPFAQAQAEADLLDPTVVAEKVKRGEKLSDSETWKARSLINEAALKAFQTGSEADIEAASQLRSGFDAGGTEEARGLASRRDSLLTPEQRQIEVMNTVFFQNTEKSTVRLNQIAEKLKRPDVSKRERFKLEKERDGIVKREAARRKKIYDKMIEEGYPLKDPDALKDPDVVASIIRRRAPENATKWDKAHELWLASVLGNPATQTANVAGNVLNATWDFTVQRMAEAMVNTVARNETGAQWGEFQYLVKGMKPGFRRGFRNMLQSWRTELPAFEAQVGGPHNYSKIETLKSPAIGGIKGRVIRAPLRALMAMDEFSKSLTAEMEAHAQAYRSGKAQGLQGDALAAHIAKEVGDLQSDAWRLGVEKAEELTFQAELGRGGKAIMYGRDAVPGARYILPFVRTPINIFKTGLAKTPLGTLRLLQRMAMDKEYTGRVLQRDIAQQAIAWGMAFGLGEALGLFNDEENGEEPFVTGTLPYTPGKQGAREIAMGAVPPMSIRLGDTWVSYARIEPIATMLGTTVDLINNIKQVKNGRDATAALGAFYSHFISQAKDKTFLRGLGDIIDATENPKSLASWASNFAASWVPNSTRASLGAAQDTLKETNLTGDLETFAPKLVGRTLERMAPGQPLMPQRPKINLWGEEVTKDNGKHAATDWLYRLTVPLQTVDLSERNPLALQLDRAILNWNNANPDDTFAPQRPSVSYQVTEKGKEKTKYWTDAQYEVLSRRTGEIALDALQKRADKINFDKPTAQQIKMIRTVLEHARSRAKVEVLRSN